MQQTARLVEEDVKIKIKKKVIEIPEKKCKEEIMRKTEVVPYDNKWSEMYRKESEKN